MAIPGIQNGCNSGLAEAALCRIQIAEQAVHVESHERTNWPTVQPVKWSPMAARNVVEKCTDGVEGENGQDKPRIS